MPKVYLIIKCPATGLAERVDSRDRSTRLCLAGRREIESVCVAFNWRRGSESAFEARFRRHFRPWNLANKHTLPLPNLTGVSSFADTFADSGIPLWHLLNSLECFSLGHRPPSTKVASLDILAAQPLQGAPGNRLLPNAAQRFHYEIEGNLGSCQSSDLLYRKR